MPNKSSVKKIKIQCMIHNAKRDEGTGAQPTIQKIKKNSHKTGIKSTVNWSPDHMHKRALMNTSYSGNSSALAIMKTDSTLARDCLIVCFAVCLFVCHPFTGKLFLYLFTSLGLVWRIQICLEPKSARNAKMHLLEKLLMNYCWQCRRC